MYRHHYLLVFLLYFLISSTVKASLSVRVTEKPTQDRGCALVDCGEGTCIGSIDGIDCECNPGWKKIQIGALAFPSCVVPNCTLDLQCDNGVLPPPLPCPPSPPPPPPPSTLIDICAYTWCGYGKCVANGPTAYTCQCNEGSSNLFNTPTFACFRQCNFGADCMGFGFGQPPPPPTNSSEDGMLGESHSRHWWNRPQPQAGSIAAVLATIFLKWV